MIASMPDMKHEGENSISLEPGETKELVWQFGKIGAVEIACRGTSYANGMACVMCRILVARLFSAIGMHSMQLKLPKD